MHIPALISKPVILIKDILWDFSFSIVNRIAVEIFVTCYSFRTGGLSDEIKHLTDAIHLLNQLDNMDETPEIHEQLTECLSPFISEGNFTPCTFTIDELRKELKCHRTSIICLYKSVAANQHLKNLIWNYCNDKESPGFKSKQFKNISPGSKTKRKLF